MSFTDHKITQFTHRVVDLPDQPNLPADELKARFDSSPEELRQAHNALCDDADRLDERVNGIIAETFGDSISKSMLSDELQDEIDAKAVETSVASRLTAEQTAREAADTALDTRLTAVETQKCEVYFGTYNGNDASYQDIELGFQPKAVIVCPQAGLNWTLWDGGAQIALLGNDSYFVSITPNGFRVKDGTSGYNLAVSLYSPYLFIAFK